MKVNVSYTFLVISPFSQKMETILGIFELLCLIYLDWSELTFRTIASTLIVITLYLRSLLKSFETHYVL